MAGRLRRGRAEVTGESSNRGMFSAEEIDAGRRLACQTLPTGDVTIAAGS